MILNKKQRKQMVIKLYENGKTTRDIAKELRMSLRDIGIIMKEINNDEPEPKPEKSDHSKALQLFSSGKTPLQVAIILDLSFETVNKWYFEYLSLNNKSDFVEVLRDHPQYLPFFNEIAKKMKRGELFKEDVDYLLANLIYCRASQHRKEWLEHEVNCLELKKKMLEDEMDEKRNL